MQGKSLPGDYTLHYYTITLHVQSMSNKVGSYLLSAMHILYLIGTTCMMYVHLTSYRT